MFSKFFMLISLLCMAALGSKALGKENGSQAPLTCAGEAPCVKVILDSYQYMRPQSQYDSTKDRSSTGALQENTKLSGIKFKSSF